MADPGPPELGRGVVVDPGAMPPDAWSSCPKVSIGPAELDHPSEAVGTLHLAWSQRRPVVVELGVDPDALRAPERYDGPVHSVSPTFEFSRERLHFLVWANNYDARSGETVWWHARKAARRSTDVGLTGDGPGDVALGDGTALWIDGGPPDPPVTAAGLGVVHRWSAESGRLTPGRDRWPTAALAPDQLTAVAHRSGPARVIAPAGSGKTRVLTERLIHLVGDRGVAPGTVTALAYNTRAAEEMKERCAGVFGGDGLHIRTLNSMALWICSTFGPAGRPRVIEEVDVRNLLQEVIDIRRQANADTVAPYIAALSAIRLGLLAPEVAEEEFPDAAGVAEGFERYRSALAERTSVDFDEQIYLAIELLLTDGAARSAAQARCRRLLVDEFQDLTPAHLLMIRLLAAPGFDCFGVGDDDQVIYGYSGASPEFLIDFGRYFPGATHHPLEVNYRCPPAVVGAARSLLSYNHRRLDKVIRPADGRTDQVDPVGGPLVGAGPVAVRTAPGDALGGAAVEIIEAWLQAGSAPSEVAVLARVNSALLPVQVACLEAGVPCSTPLSTQVLGRTGLRTAFAYLRIGADPGRIRRQDVRDTIRRPSRGIAPMVADMLTKGATTSITDIRRLADRLSGRDVPKLRAYADDLDAVSAAAARSSVEALRCIRTGIGLTSTMDALDSSRREADRSTHADDLVALEAVAALHPDAATFEEWLRGMLSRPAVDGPTVLLSTVHRIKGKEWDRVIVYGASEGLFPHRLSDDVEGERRVFHVALTRARAQVAVLADAAAPSIFVAELDGSSAHPVPPGRTASVDRPDRDRTAASTPRRAAAGPQAAATPAERALRAWRSAVAKRDGVPAYVVLTDKDLVGIAADAPATLAALGGCRGIGPLKLERWGDEILAVLESTGAAGRPG